jgi:hypothetical protein
MLLCCSTGMPAEGTTQYSRICGQRRDRGHAFDNCDLPLQQQRHLTADAGINARTCGGAIGMEEPLTLAQMHACNTEQ